MEGSSTPPACIVRRELSSTGGLLRKARTRWHFAGEVQALGSPRAGGWVGWAPCSAALSLLLQQSCLLPPDRPYKGKCLCVAKQHLCLVLKFCPQKSFFSIFVCEKIEKWRLAQSQGKAAEMERSTQQVGAWAGTGQCCSHRSALTQPTLSLRAAGQLWPQNAGPTQRTQRYIHGFQEGAPKSV